MNNILNKIDSLSIKYYYRTLVEPNNKKYKIMSDFFSNLSTRFRKLIT